MGQMIQFLEMSGASSCAQAVIPVVKQGTALFDAAGPNLGSSPVALLATGLVTGDNAGYGGQIVNSGCFDLAVSVAYLGGGDCDPCTTPDTLTATTIAITVPKNSSFPLPDGFWTAITATVIDAAGAPVNLTGTATQTVRLYSAYTPACPACAVLVP